MGKEQVSEGGREQREVRREDRLFEREERRERAKAKSDPQRLFWREEPRGKSPKSGWGNKAGDVELFSRFERTRARGWDEAKPLGGVEVG